MFVDDELFFPLGIYLSDVKESDLVEVNKTHFNVILPYSQLDKKVMDMIYTTQQGKLKVIYSLKSLYTLDSEKCSDLNEEENYVKFVNKVNEFKDHPNLLSWYINDEYPFCLNRNLRNRTLSIHELDPNYPSYSVLCYPQEVNQLMNSTDIMGLDMYPIGVSSIKKVYEYNEIAYNQILESKPMIPVVQIFDWAYYYWNRGQTDFESSPPTLEEMRNMSWQTLVAGGKGIIFYSFLDLFRMNEISPFENRWKDIIEFTNEIWKYKDVILSIDKVDEIEYNQNYNVKYKQWKYNNSYYVVFVNLERNEEICKINLLDKYEINKEFGLGTFKENGTEIILNLESIDVIMMKFTEIRKQYSNNSEEEENL